MPSEKEQIKAVLKCYRRYKLGFSKLKIISIDEEGKLERIRLKVDPIRQAQREYLSEMRKREQARKEKIVAKSMQFTEDDLAKTQLHQIQPSVMLRKEMQVHEEVRGESEENEEDAIDCQEGNKTPFNQYSMSGKQVMFQNNEVMLFQSPRQQHSRQQLLFLDEDMPVQTHRIMDENFDDQMLLETPVHRIGTQKDE